MAALITALIAAQSFELVRDKVGAILALELANQVTLGGDDVLGAEVWKERIIPFDKTELPAINVTVMEGNYDGQTVKQADGTYTILIDGEVNAKSTSANDGDKLAMLKCQKLMGCIRAIIQDPQYRTLGYAQGFVMSRQITKIAFGNKYQGDALNTVMGRLMLTVKVPETTELLEAVEIGGSDTTVKLEETEKGYKWTVNA